MMEYGDPLATDHPHRPGPARAFQYRYLICGVIFLSYIFVYFHRLCPAVIALDMQQAFNTTGTLLGVLGSAYFYPYAIMQVPVGLLADFWGPRKTVASFFVLAGLGSLAMGVAPVLGLAILGRILVGFGVSTVFVCNFKLLSEWFTPREFVVMGGIFMSAGGIGVLSASAPLAWASNLIGWRMTLIFVGLFSFVLSALVYLVVRNRPVEMGWPPVYKLGEKGSEEGVGLWQGVRQVIFARRFWPVAIWAFCGVGVFFSLAGLWAGPYFMHIYGMSKAAAGAVLSMSAFSFIAGSPLLSLASNVVGRKRVFIGCSVILIIVFGLFYVFPQGLPLLVLYVLYFFFSFAGGAIGPLHATVAKELFPTRIAGTSVGAVNFFPFFGGALFQVIIGWIVSHGGQSRAGYGLAGYQNMFLFCLIIAIVSLIAAVLLTETFPGGSRRRPASDG
jgi:sugar phosphate permease